MLSTSQSLSFTETFSFLLGSEMIMPAADEIQHIAGSKTYDRGVGYRSHVKGLSSSPEMGGMFVTCRCKTSRCHSVL